MTPTRRWLLGTALTLGATGLCFAAVAFVTARCCVPAGSGLAGAGIVVGYGLMGALAGAVAAVLLAWRLPPRALTWLTVPVALLGGAVLISVYLAVRLSRAELDEHLQQAHAQLNPFRVTVIHTEAAVEHDFHRLDLDWSKRRYDVAGNGRSCSVALSGAQAVTMLGALRQVEGVMLKDPFPCAGTLGAVTHEVEFFVAESTPPDTQGRLALTAACLAQYPALAAPLSAAADIHEDNGWPDDCGP